ncbi:uncharacterized protein VP01_1609g11 [Puccinia sorghi]|uniref:Uncharacterized protein n=1 Tax=Puccinia sorghi TaxID=27349 RepID=A0A0L6VHS4_9BASI|nr:uncharacterized protein VP01_1609g11 [Puccinia sorghi]
MKAVDIGFLLHVCKLWEVMSHWIKTLQNDSGYLNWMVPTITKILPTTIANLLKHSLLFLSSGHEVKFLEEDFFGAKNLLAQVLLKSKLNWDTS